MTSLTINTEEQGRDSLSLRSALVATVGTLMLMSTLYLSGMAPAEARASQNASAPCPEEMVSVRYLA
ncbi:MAG: hypothetical protein R3E02_09750 [Blastomonas sp.]